jgi:hypothetical protein
VAVSCAIRARTSSSVVSVGSSTVARNQRGATPQTATSLALISTAKRPASLAVSVIGSVAATSAPASTSMTAASSPRAGPRRTAGSSAGSAASSSASSAPGSLPAGRGLAGITVAFATT